MAWHTMKMQSVLDRWNTRRSTAVPPDLIGRIAPTRTEGINLRDVFTFPIEQNQAQLLPFPPAAKSRLVASGSTINMQIGDGDENVLYSSAEVRKVMATQFLVSRLFRNGQISVLGIRP